MRKSAAIISVSMLILTTGSSMACEHPNSITIPDGMSATEADMIAASDSVKRYAVDMNAYIACLDGEANDARVRGKNDDVGAQVARENAETKKHNAAAEELIEVNSLFMAAVDDYELRR